MVIKNKKFNFNDYGAKELWEKFGIIGVNLIPFQEKRYSYNLEDEDDIRELKEHVLSTVYKGIRYFFKTSEQLKTFCEMVEF